jgi:hypothetical protein
MKQFIIVFFLILLFGCDQVPFLKEYYTDYELTVEKDKIVRFDKINGEIIVIQNDGQIIKHDNISIYKETILKEPGLKTSRKSFPGSSEMFGNLSYKWKSNKILFDYKFGPYSGGIGDAKDAYDNFEVIFVDSDNLPIVTKSIYLKDAIRTVGSDNKPVYWHINGEIYCKLKDFNDISNFTYQWSFSDKLDKAIESFDKKLKAKKKKETSQDKKVIPASS